MHDDEYDEFFRANYPRLVVIGMAMSSSRAVAQDLAQETMLRAYHNRDELSSYGSPLAWCRRVMSNLVIDHHRTTVVQHSVATRLSADRTDDDTTNDPAIATTNPRWADLIAPLTATQRAVATLYYAEDQPVSTIAHTLGISPGTVKSTLSKARASLRRHLAAQQEAHS
ncbi:MAG TPA: sigma-70 family RNA polymerase sigma factor [Ilumatobacteraceae bacterium]|nr:sigma-70 family RNA polymerase sigma factor [Ilumatobacteraceae bacterium]